VGQIYFGVDNKKHRQAQNACDGTQRRYGGAQHHDVPYHPEKYDGSLGFSGHSPGNPNAEKKLLKKLAMASNRL
jgi:hypothetical protein